MNRSAGNERRRVFQASLAALGLGSLVAVAAVLPAEYGVDPTGLGRALGLLQLSSAQRQSEAAMQSEAAIPGPAAAATGETVRGTTARVDKTLVLAPGKGVEYKLQMAGGAQAGFRWMASGVVHFDQHGEPAGDTSGYYESYAVGNADAVQGRFTALFDGTHGWYWRNDQDRAITIELTVAGAFDALDPPSE
jgi:hypothetical protein